MSARIKNFRKPKSMVAGDVFPSVLTKFCDFFAMPLTDIFNEIASSGVWPLLWKTEYVTIIPKKSCPEDFGDLRNISCTMLISKIMESYVLQWVGHEVDVKLNQYGGVKGCSGSHMIVKVWQQILRNLEDRRAATVLTSIDYAKAFNRLSFQHCLASFAQRGASMPVLRLLASFLTDQTMTVRVGSAWSRPRQVTGGCPQGSILGVLLFNITTDDLEDGSTYVSHVDRPEVGIPGDDEEDEDFYGPDADSPAWGAVGPVSPDGINQLTCSDNSFHTACSELSSADDVFESSKVSDSTIPLNFSPSPIRRPDLFDFDVGPAIDNGRRQRRVIYSPEGDMTSPPEPTTTCLANDVHD